MLIKKPRPIKFPTDLDWRRQGRSFQKKMIAFWSIPIIVIITVICVLAIPSKKTAYVTGINWRYQVDLRQKTKMHAEEWGRPYNKDVITIKCESRYYGQKDCMCRRDDDGHEHCSSCPRYEDWCIYDYWDWPIVRTDETSGASHEVKWPILVAQGPDQRTDRTQEYKVFFKADKTKEKSWEFNPASLEDFKRFNVEDIWEINAYIYGKATPLENLHAEK